MELSIENETRSNGRHVIALVGSLDLAGKDAAKEAGTRALTTVGVTALVLDLAGISFMDSSGVGMLVELSGHAASSHKGFALRQPSDQVRRILHLTGLSAAWPVEDARP